MKSNDLKISVIITDPSGKEISNFCVGNISIDIDSEASNQKSKQNDDIVIKNEIDNPQDNNFDSKKREAARAALDQLNSKLGKSFSSS